MRSNGAGVTLQAARKILHSLESGDGDYQGFRIPTQKGSPVPGHLAEVLNRIFERLISDRQRSRQEREELLRVLTAVERGDFTTRSSPMVLHGEIAKSLNRVIELNEALASEVSRVGRLVGKEGKLAERAALPKAQGAWGTSVRSINALVDDLVQPTIEAARVIGSVAQGNLSQTM